MRKDYTSVDTDNGSSETAFVERYWTEVWRTQGDPQRRLRRVRLQPEYRVLRRVLPPPSPTVRVLDGGCGLGEWTVMLHRAGYDVTGLDISRETIAVLQRLFPDTPFAVADIRATGFPDRHFDAYFSWGVFEHFEEGLQGCITEARRILKPGGRLIISVPFHNRRLRRRSPPATPQPGSRFYQWRLERDELRGELERDGFIVDEVRPIHRRQGVMRALHHDWGIPYGRMNRLLGFALAPFAPAETFSHMLIAAARRSP